VLTYNYFHAACVRDNMATLDRVLEKYAKSQDLMDQIRYTAESLSLRFDQWGEPYVSGPSLYFLIVAEVNFDAYTDPLGENEWPVERCQVVDNSLDDFTKVARDVAFSRDGAVIVTGDGTIQEQMVRVRSPSPAEVKDIDDLKHGDWMGTKHLSALETSLREDVLWGITLSEEDGRVTTFLNGTYQDYPREEIGGRWRPE
jgi:diadenylate cyclase